MSRGIFLKFIAHLNVSWRLVEYDTVPSLATVSACVRSVDSKSSMSGVMNTDGDHTFDASLPANVSDSAHASSYARRQSFHAYRS